MTIIEVSLYYTIKTFGTNLLIFSYFKISFSRELIRNPYVRYDE